MELADAVRIPLAPSVVWDALQDLALLRASLENCESFVRMAHGEFALTMTVPLGPLRARYETRAHVAGQDSGPADAQRRTINFKARAEGIGSLRGQIEVRLYADERGPGLSLESSLGSGLESGPDSRTGSRPDSRTDSRTESRPGGRASSMPGGGESRERGTHVEYTIWATSSGPLAELPTRQLEKALHDIADDFFTEFDAVVRAKYGEGPNLARGPEPRRQHVFLRPITLGGIARRARAQHGGAASGSQSASHGLTHDVRREPNAHAVPNWAWAAMIFVVALLLYVAHWFSEQ
jgi:carbon monoxide dehydrogenase subunit G